MIKNAFRKEVAEELIARINNLQPNTQPQWGVMKVDQMLAHCSVAYHCTYSPEKFKKAGSFKKFLLKTFVKPMVVGEKPYPKNGRTASEFIIADRRDFEKEKNELIQFITHTQELGEKHFEGKDNISFGKMTAKEWNVLFYKHLDHHLNQFGV